jgi:hypothetical protein
VLPMWKNSNKRRLMDLITNEEIIERINLKLVQEKRDYKIELFKFDLLRYTGCEFYLQHLEPCDFTYEDGNGIRCAGHWFRENDTYWTTVPLSLQKVLTDFISFIEQLGIFSKKELCWIKLNNQIKK